MSRPVGRDRPGALLAATVPAATLLAVTLVAGTLVAGCAASPSPGSGSEVAGGPAGWEAVQDSTHRLFSIEGLSGPEAVRYDPDQDVWFVSNWNGGGNERNADGFISRVASDGTMESMRFMVGGRAAPLHAPRGMFIVGDTLWVADVDGVHGFNRRSGDHVAFADLRHLEPGFLNDVAAGDDGVPHVTDSSRPLLYRVITRPDGSRSGEVALEDEGMGPANGITWDGANRRFVFAPWGPGVTTFRAWRPGEAELVVVGVSADGGRFDGIEMVGSRILAASQLDRALHLVDASGGRAVVLTPGAPADIGIDTRRHRVAVPYIALNRVDVWQLPPW